VQNRWSELQPNGQRMRLGGGNWLRASKESSLFSLPCRCISCQFSRNNGEMLLLAGILKTRVHHKRSASEQYALINLVTGIAKPPIRSGIATLALLRGKTTKGITVVPLDASNPKTIEGHAYTLPSIIGRRASRKVEPLRCIWCGFGFIKKYF